MEREDCRVCKCLKVPGVRFDPTDEELVAYYLTEKIEGRPLPCNHIMTELKIYDDDLMPWEIVKDDNPYWITCSSNKKAIYVFTELGKKGSRVMRRSGHGSWTSQNNSVVMNKAGNGIGYNRLLTFYEDNNGKKAKKKIVDDEEHGHWIMHEYSLFGMDNYVLCKIIKRVNFSSKVSLLCPTKTAANQDFHRQVLMDAEIMNVASDDERQLGGGDQTLDESTTDWDKNGWAAELNQLLGTDLGTTGRADYQNQTEISYDTSGGAGVVQELPVVAIMLHPQQGHDFLDSSLEEGAEIVQEVAVGVSRENVKIDGSYNGLDGAGGNRNIIILDDDSTNVQDELMIIEAENATRVQAINVDDQVDYTMECEKENPDDFWNFKIAGADLVGSQGDPTWDGVDVILDFSSPELSALWGDDEVNELSFSMFKSQPEKRTRHCEEDYEECPSGKKQRFLSK